jgi:hypothetical protein
VLWAASNQPCIAAAAVAAAAAALQVQKHSSREAGAWFVRDGKVMSALACGQEALGSDRRPWKPALAPASTRRKLTHHRPSCRPVHPAPQVYDPTPFLDKHPGGADVILSSAGGDASKMFDTIHPEYARKMAVQFLIGAGPGAGRPRLQRQSRSFHCCVCSGPQLPGCHFGAIA